MQCNNSRFQWSLQNKTQGYLEVQNRRWPQYCAWYSDTQHTTGPRGTLPPIVTPTLGQQRGDPDGTYCIINHNKMIFYWEGGKISKHITLDKNSNWRFIRTTPSYQKYNKFYIAMNSQAGQSNDEWRDIEKPNSQIEKQTDEEIEP